MTDTVEISQQKTLKKFGTTFQLTALRLFIQDAAFAQKIRPVVQTSYFETKYLRWICKAVIEYEREYKERPIPDTIKSLIETSFDEEKTKIYLKTLEDVLDASVENRKFVEDEMHKFCFVKHAKQLNAEIEAQIELGNFEEAQRLSHEMFKPAKEEIKIFDLKEDYEIIFNEFHHGPIGTPLPSMNRVSKEGPGSGNLAIAVGPSNFGKSNWLVAVARAAAVQGYSVAYFSFEIAGEHLISRSLAGLVDQPQERLEDHQGKIELELEALQGNIKIIHIKATQATLDRVKFCIEDLKSQGFFPDIVLLDGLNQLKLPNGFKHLSGDNNSKFEYLCEEARDMAGDLCIPVHTVFQTNRGGFNQEINDEQNIGKAIEPFQVADWLIMFAQTIEMEADGECNVTLLKNRLGPKGLTLKLRYDPNKCVFTELETVQRSLLYDQAKQKTLQKGVGQLESFVKDLHTKKKEKLEKPK